MRSDPDSDDDPDPAELNPRARIRNIGIAAHIDAGKTTTTERILYYTGRTHKIGDVDDGTTITDFDKQEQDRGITIFSAAVTCPWRDHTINLIDTPGHVDFTAEVERSLRVLDGMVAVFDAKEGVEAQSETVWRQADKYHVPRLCYVNKMDKIGADFAETVREIRNKLHGRPVPVFIPIGQESTFEGVIDLLHMQAVYFDQKSQGAAVQRGDVPEALLQEANTWRNELIETIAETDEALMEKYVLGEMPRVDELVAALRRATLDRKIEPVFCGSSLKNMGVQPLLDGVIDYLPSPLDRGAVTAHVSLTDAGELRREPREDEPLAALVFKIVADKPLDLYYVRVYSGVLKSGSRLFNATRGVKENLSQMFRMFAKRREAIQKVGPGEIVAVVGLKDSLTGDTLCDARHACVLERIEFPDPVISVAIEPKSSGDRDLMGETLKRLSRQDPTFRYRVDTETGQTLISGMGELHLEVLVYKLRSDFNVDVNVGKPRVSYREAISQPAEAEGRFIRQLGGRGHFAVVKLRIEPFDPAGGHVHFQFENRLPAGKIRPEYVAAIETGCRDAMLQGVLASYEMLNVRASLLDAQEHDVDSSEVAFENAARLAFHEACENARPVLLEPIMRVQVVTPSDYFGTVTGDLNSRRAMIVDTTFRGNLRVIDADAPLAEMFGYATVLRSLTQGRASWTMEPKTYQAVPANVQAQLLSSY